MKRRFLPGEQDNDGNPNKNQKLFSSTFNFKPHVLGAPSISQANTPSFIQQAQQLLKKIRNKPTTIPVQTNSNKPEISESVNFVAAKKIYETHPQTGSNFPTDRMCKIPIRKINESVRMHLKKLIASANSSKNSPNIIELEFENDLLRQFRPSDFAKNIRTITTNKIPLDIKCLENNNIILTFQDHSFTEIKEYFLKLIDCRTSSPYNHLSLIKHSTYDLNNKTLLMVRSKNLEKNIFKEVSSICTRLKLNVFIQQQSNEMSIQFNSSMPKQDLGRLLQKMYELSSLEMQKIYGSLSQINFAIFQLLSSTLISQTIVQPTSVPSLLSIFQPKHVDTLTPKKTGMNEEQLMASQIEDWNLDVDHLNEILNDCSPLTNSEEKFGKIISSSHNVPSYIQYAEQLLKNNTFTPPAIPMPTAVPLTAINPELFQQEVSTSDDQSLEISTPSDPSALEMQRLDAPFEADLDNPFFLFGGSLAINEQQEKIENYYFPPASPGCDK